MINFRDTYHKYDTQRSIKEFYNYIHADHFLSHEGTGVSVVNNRTGNAPFPQAIPSEEGHDGIRRIETGFANAESRTVDSFFSDSPIIKLSSNTIYIITLVARLDKHSTTNDWNWFFGLTTDDVYYKNSSQYLVLEYDYSMQGNSKIYLSIKDGLAVNSTPTEFTVSGLQKQWHRFQIVINTIMQETSVLIGHNDNILKEVAVISNNFLPESFGISTGMNKYFGNSTQRTLDIDYFSFHTLKY